ncbi:hemagglutinin repeat-containing protein [Kosakonia pseudosacchari]|uniref:hemagglutinin repeat-containing protein n=1 Tax=Kosakonia pseudosacchari TaxID=1646340 RepID=UPI0026EA8FF3|nr:hemagglutinin repeat-containing protein [Kosakonia pseudosacchari]
MTLTGSHKAGGDIAVNSTQDVALNSATLAADGKLTLAGNGNTTLTASKIAAGQTALSAKQINGDAESQLSTAGNATLEAQGISWRGELTAGGNSRITADKLDNAGTITAKGQLTATIGALKNSGTLQGQALEINSQTTNNSGTLMAAGDTRITAGQLDNQGTVAAKGNLTATTSTLNNGGTLQGQSLGVTGDALHNSGSLLSEGDTRLTATQLDNQGTVAAKGQLTATTSTLKNGGTLQGQTLAVSGDGVQNNGTLAADDSLNVKAGALTTGTGSTVTAKGDVTLTAQTTADIGGQVNAGKALSVKAADLQTRQQAQLQSGSDLTLAADNTATLNGTQAAKGTLSVTAKSVSHGGKSNASAITLTAPDVLNNSGTLVADTFSLGSQHVTSSGLLQGTQALNLQTDWLENLTGGTLYSAKDLTLAIPQLSNSGLITTDGDLHLHGNSLTSSGELNGVNLFSDYTRLENSGRLLADNTLSLTADDIRNGGVLAAKNTAITANTLSNTGSVQGDDALTLNAQNTSNGGALATVGTLNLSGQTLDNQGNLSATTLLLTLAQQVNNAADGRMVAGDSVTLNAPQLTNSGLIAAKKLTLNSADITSSGTLQGTALLTASGTTLTNQQGGLLLSNGAVTLKNDRLDNAGQIQGDTLNLATGQWMNTGTVLGQSGLTATVSGTLDNQGQVVSRQGMTLTAGNSSNSGALMAKVLALHGDLHSSGLIQGADTLTWDGNTLTTSADGQLVSGGSLALQGNALDNAGRMQGKTLTATADSLHNSGTVQAQDALNAQVSGTLANQGQILSQGQADIRAAQLDNDGQLLSAGDITLRGQQLTNNGSVQGKTLSAHEDRVTNNGTLTGLDSLTLDNSPATATLMARMAMATPQLELINAGSLLTQGSLDITAGNVNNTGTWQGNNILLAAQSLDNRGTIQSAGALNLQLAGNLTSATGSKITAMGTAALQALALTNNGQWAAKNLTISGGTLNNNGVISGSDGLTATLSGDITQQSGGSLVSNGALNLTAQRLGNGGNIQGGGVTVSADILTNNAGAQLVSGQGLTLTTPQMLNDGLIQGAGESRITAATQARNEGKLLSGGALTLTTPQYSGAGWLQATDLILNAANNATTGTLLADRMTLTGDTFTNQGITQANDLTLNYRQLTNNGTLLGNRQLTVNAAQVNESAAGRLFSGGDLLVGANGLNALGQIVALGNLTLQLADAFTGKTALAAGKTLSITSNGAIDNQSVMQGQAVNLSAGGQLTNSGQITTGSGASTLSGSNIVLNGNSSLQGGGDVTLASRGNITANGFAGTLGSLTLSAPGSIVNTAQLYAANNLALYAGSITNQRGDMLAGNNLWLQRDAAGNANTEVVNTSGTIETRNGDITINTGHLLNTRDGLTANTVKTTPQVIPGVGDPALSVHYSLLPTGSYGYYTVKDYVEGNNCAGADGGCDSWTETTYHYAPFEGKSTQKFVLSETRTDVSSSGGSARIASGRNAVISASVLDNKASDIVSANNLLLRGAQLNNQSWQNSVTSDVLVYKYGTGKDVTYAEFAIPAGGLKNKNDRYDQYVQNIPYTLIGHEIETTRGQIYRAVIQAGGNVSASFSSNISNTATTSNANGVSGTITAPSLNTLSNQSIGGSVAKQTLAAEPVTINSPQWQDQLHNALQQINGGNAGSLTNADVTSAVLKNTSTGALDAHQGKSVDTSAYPLPSGNNGYFVVSANPKSPYLITVNPKLDGLGQLDPNLFGDLNKLLGVTPSAAPRETSSTYTDEKQFLGSAYMLDRIKLNPDHDYRFLGDAAFDTRYVSNVVLNQTGNRYLNGIGSDLAQMQYLMDNAANAQQSLGLQFGVALNADQIAALDHSILWWESATINGETVMIPKVYLSPKDVTVNNGSVIAGNNVSLEGGSVTNTGGTLLARNNLSVESDGAIINSNDALMKAGGNVSLSAIGDISNLSSTISGKTVALESLDGSINNITLVDQFALNTKSKSGSVSLKNTTLGTNASITATDGLSLAAGKDITLTGATLKAGGDLLMDAGGNIAVNAIEKNNAYGQSGFKAGYLRQTATSREQVSYQGSSITSGGNLAMQAGNDLTLSASDVSAGKDAKLSAGNDLNLNAQQTRNNSRNGKSENHSTGLDRTTVSAGNNLILTAGQDINSQAAGLAAEQQVGMQAGRDVNLLAEATTQGDSYKASKKTVINEQVRQQGTEIASGKGTTIIAGRDMNAEAAQVTAKGDIDVQAGRDVNLTTATESDYHYKEKTKTKKGFLKKTTTHTISEQSATRESGTLLSGDNVTVKSGHDLLVKGSSVVGDGDVALSAAHNVDITAATNTDSNWQFKEKKKSGLMGSGGIGFTIGSSKTRQDLKEKGTTQSQSMSTVGSNGGDVTVTAGNQLHVGGSDLIAKNDLALSGDSVVIDPGHDKRTTDQKFEQKSSGLTLALSGAMGDVVNTAASTAMAAKDQSDGRLAALQGTKAVLSGIQASQASRLAAAKTGSDDATKNGSFGVMVSIGGQSSKSTSHSEQDTTTGSTLNAGNDLNISATGKGNAANSGDITVAGSQLKAGKDLTLDAARDITLTGAADTQKTTGSNSSKGGSIGVGITAGPNGAGFMVSASANAGKGGEKGNGTTWNETTLDAGQNISLKSGRDTLLQGAQVNGDNVTADVGRDLTLSSLQDSNNYNSKQQNVSGGLSYTFGPGGGLGASFSYSRDKMKSNYDSVQEQTGIFAGKGGFDVTVGNHTQLDGAVLASRADADKNRLDTGTLGFADINNKADFKTEHQGAGFSTSGSMIGNVLGNMANVMLAGMNGKGHAEGTTQSAVADGTIVIRDKAGQQQNVATLSRDTEHANGSIDPIFDKEKEQRRLQTAQMIGEIGTQVADIARTEGAIASEKAKQDPAALQAAKETLAGLGKLNPTKEEIADQAGRTAEAQYGTGSPLQRGITAATAAIQALAGGDIKAALAGAAAPEIAYLIGQNVNDDAAKVIAHAVVNAVLAAASGKNAATAAAGAATGELAGIIALDAWGIKDVSKLSEEQKQTVSALATLASGLAGALVGDSGANAIAGAQAGKTTAENNSLSDGWNNVLSSGTMDYGQSVRSYVKYAQDNNLSPEQVQAGLVQMVKGDLPESADIIKAILSNNPGSDTVMALLTAEDAKDYALALLTSIPAEKALSLVGKAAKVIDNKILIRAAEKISTAKSGLQSAVPRDLNEQMFWKQVESNPLGGTELKGMNKDPRFPGAAGFQKMEATHKLPDGSSMSIHYQYNSVTGKAYDMKITTPQPNPLQPGPSLKDVK